MEEIWTQLDLEASKQQQRTYIDPQSGYRFYNLWIASEKELLWLWMSSLPLVTEVSDEYRQEIRQTPWIEGDTGNNDTFDVVSWSGGKDSYLAGRTQRKSKTHLLMTTFDEITQK